MITLEQIEEILERYFKTEISGGDDGDAEGCVFCGNNNWSFDTINHEEDCIVPKIFEDIKRNTL